MCLPLFVLTCPEFSIVYTSLEDQKHLRKFADPKKGFVFMYRSTVCSTYVTVPVPYITVLRIRIRDGEKIAHHISESLETIFWVKILKFLDEVPGSSIFLTLDPGSGMKKSDPGSGINIRIRYAGLNNIPGNHRHRFPDLGKVSSQRSLSAITVLKIEQNDHMFLYLTTTEGFYNSVDAWRIMLRRRIRGASTRPA
jgi:hypothetical protein